ncbi:MAG: hypothetical protein J0H68_08565 [Sphingobacteriia bacterium]|nr:hypothetical protein [Sphingobacteriia bacterium]
MRILLSYVNNYERFINRNLDKVSYANLFSVSRYLLAFAAFLSTAVTLKNMLYEKHNTSIKKDEDKTQLIDAAGINLAKSFALIPGVGSIYNLLNSGFLNVTVGLLSLSLLYAFPEYRFFNLTATSIFQVTSDLLSNNKHTAPVPFNISLFKDYNKAIHTDPSKAETRIELPSKTEKALSLISFIGSLLPAYTFYLVGKRVNPVRLAIGTVVGTLAVKQFTNSDKIRKGIDETTKALTNLVRF